MYRKRRGGGNRYNHRNSTRHGAYQESADGEQSYSGHKKNRQGEWREDRNPEDQGQRLRPPPGLKGREIGMWYAKFSRAKKVREDRTERQEVKMGQRNEFQIRRLLHNIQSADSMPQQPSTSYAPLVSTNSSSSSSDDDDDYDSTPQCKEVQQQAVGGACGGFDETREVENEEVNVDSENIPQLTDIIHSEGIEDVAFGLQLSSIQSEDRQDVEEDDHLNKAMKVAFDEKKRDSRYRKMLEFRQKLPAYQSKEEILEILRKNQVVVISGETGCGKTTQVPQFILDDFIERGHASQCSIICTQPRRISAISVAERVADERAETCGQEGSVGYQIRLEKKMPRRRGSMLFCTTGIVLKLMESDRLLHRASHIIIDEIHERDLLSDFLMIIVKDILAKRRDLKLILMSATLNAVQFSKYFLNCPMLNIPGFTYPVEEYCLEDVVELLNYRVLETHKVKRRGRGKWKERELEQWNFDAWIRNLDDNQFSTHTKTTLRNMEIENIDFDLIVQLIRHICFREGDGALLVFVPGWTDISKLNDLIKKEFHSNNERFLIIPLHSLMPTVNQRQVFDRPPPGVRKIVIATNIAETSITIDDVVFVIDCGKIKVKDFNSETNLTTLEPQWVSKANARQRRGRAGRTQAGKCYHLYTSLKEVEMNEYLPPEILRTRLEELCLNIKLLKLGKIEPFISKAMARPSTEAIRRAIVTLQDLNALDKDENSLPLGKHLARMPVDPHMGKMILFGSMFCCLDPILTVAASLAFKDAFVMPLGKEKEVDSRKRILADGCKSDHILLIKMFTEWEKAKHRRTDRQFCWDNYLSANTLQLLASMKKQLCDLLFELKFVKNRNPKDMEANINSSNNSLIKAVLCAGLYPNVVKVVRKPRRKGNRNIAPRLHTKEGVKSVYLHPKSVNCKEVDYDSQWLIYHLMMKTNSINIFDSSMVSPYPLLFFGGAINIGKDDTQDIITVDGWIKFRAAPRIAYLVQDLRGELDKLLDHKITYPGMTDWRSGDKEGQLLQAIIHLITTEDTSG